MTEWRVGHLGMLLESGEVVLTVTGGVTTPFPKFKPVRTDRGCTILEKKVEKWLMENAHMEALRRGDEFNALQFKGTLDMLASGKFRPSKADKDFGEMYLFDPLAIYHTPRKILHSL